MSAPTKTWRARLMAWHRRAGVLASVALLVLAFTGILLNHTEALKLDERYVTQQWLLGWYGIDLEQIALHGYALGEHWLVKVDRHVLQDQHLLGECEGDLRVMSYQGEIWAICDHQAWLFTLQGQMLESRSGDHHDVLQQGDASLMMPQLVPLTAMERLPARWLHSIHWERVVLDLHSGRLLGRAGVWLFDLAGVLLMFLALSGVYVWAIKSRQKQGCQKQE